MDNSMSSTQQIKDLMDEIQTLKKQHEMIIKHLQTVDKQHRSSEKQLTKQIQTLTQRLDVLEGDQRLEAFYQKYLEQKYGCSHSKGAFGITDLETASEVIEIKQWSNYKAALGQLLSYTSSLHDSNCTNKRAIVYFFGKKPTQIESIVRLFNVKGIHVYHLDVDCYNQITEASINVETFATEFEKWCMNHIVYEPNAFLKLSDALCLYLGTQSTLHSKQATIYRTSIEHFIKNTFPNIKHTYGKVRCSIDRTAAGWKHVKLI